MAQFYYKNGSSWINALNLFYPIGAVYASTTSTSPGTLFGGTWQQISNAVLRAAVAYGYGGSDSMTLSVSNMPSHEHRLLGNFLYDSAGDGNDALWYIGHKTNTNNKWTTSFCEATGGGKRFQSFPVIAISIVRSELANGRKGVL